MVVTSGQAPRRGSAEDQHETAAVEVVNLCTLAPLCDEEEFSVLVDEMVADEAPHLFAVVQEYAERVDGRIAAWGIAFEDHAEVVSVDRGMRMSLQSPECAVRRFARRPCITARLVWVKPEAATRARRDEAA